MHFTTTWEIFPISWASCWAKLFIRKWKRNRRWYRDEEEFWTMGNVPFLNHLPLTSEIFLLISMRFGSRPGQWCGKQGSVKIQNLLHTAANCAMQQEYSHQPLVKTVTFLFYFFHQEFCTLTHAKGMKINQFTRIILGMIFSVSFCFLALVRNRFIYLGG